MKLSSQIKKNRARGLEEGFSLPEVMTAAAILASISTIAIPGYIGQKKASCQGHPESIISQVMMQTQAYQDEYKSPAKSWNDIDKIATIMTKAGPAKGTSLEWIELPSCNYKLKATQSGNQYIFHAAQIGSFMENPQEIEIDEKKNTYNVVGCLNTSTGASEILKSDGKTAVKISELRCSQS